MRSRWGIAALGDRVACVEIRRRSRGALRGVVHGESGRVPDGAARLLPPHCTMVTEGSAEELERMRLRFERLAGRPLVLSRLVERSGRQRAILVAESAVRALPAGARAVALPSALAVLAAFAGVRSACGVYWAAGDSHFLYAARGGLPLAESAHGLPVLALTSPDEAGEEWIAAAHPTARVQCKLEGLESLPPLALLAAGVALAARRRGSFPALPRRGRHLRSEPARWGASMALLLATAVVEIETERGIARLEVARAERHQELERRRWEIEMSAAVRPVAERAP